MRIPAAARRLARPWLLTLAGVFLLAAAVGHWAYWYYDPGPDIGLAEVATLEIASGGWREVPVGDSPSSAMARFFDALASARSFWPPDLKFE